MASYWLAVLSLLVLVTSCFSQDRGGVDPKIALPLLKNVLGTAHASGSLAYWGRCDFHTTYPDFPWLQPLSNYSGSPLEVLQKMFANDPKMYVTQDPNGLIRMLETDVSSDLLEVRIRHVSFGLPESLSDISSGPNNAMRLVLSTPEVKAFRRAHNVGPFSERWVGPGDSASKHRVSGDLYDVTLSEALDYILQTFPGFWIYENCRSDEKEGGRRVFFAFFETDPQSFDVAPDGGKK